LTAPPDCVRDAIPTLDASRVSQWDERTVWALLLLLSACASAPTANKVNIPAARHRRDAISVRKLKKAVWRIFLIFMVTDLGGESQTVHLPMV
jgi:hypothetical protein